jgi:hypothetical protein
MCPRPILFLLSLLSGDTYKKEGDNRSATLRAALDLCSVCMKKGLGDTYNRKQSRCLELRQEVAERDSALCFNCLVGRRV